MPVEINTQVEVLLSTSASFWNLISENEFLMTNLKDFTRVRTFSAEAEGITNIEELISGEDSLRDVLINSIAFMLNWKANTIWVDSAKKARTAMTKNYMLEIQDRIWQYIKESNKQADPIDLEQSEQIRERAEKFLQLIQVSELTTDAQGNVAAPNIHNVTQIPTWTTYNPIRKTYRKMTPNKGIVILS